MRGRPKFVRVSLVLVSGLRCQGGQLLSNDLTQKHHTWKYIAAVDPADSHQYTFSVVCWPSWCHGFYWLLPSPGDKHMLRMLLHPTSSVHLPLVFVPFAFWYSSSSLPGDAVWCLPPVWYKIPNILLFFPFFHLLLQFSHFIFHTNRPQSSLVQLWSQFHGIIADPMVLFSR